MRRITALPVLALASVLFAEDPPKNAFVVPHDWHGFQEGSWVEIRTKVSSSANGGHDETMRWTLKGAKDGGVTLDLGTLKNGEVFGSSVHGAFDTPDEVVEMTQEVTAVHLEGSSWVPEKK